MLIIPKHLIFDTCVVITINYFTHQRSFFSNEFFQEKNISMNQISAAESETL